MSKLARVNFFRAISYRGGQPMIAWLLHRITGIGIVLFVSLHVFASFFLYSTEGGATNSISEFINTVYESLPMQLFILFSILYHAINGLRVVILDMWPRLHPFHREAMWVQWALFLPLFLLPAALMVMRVTV